MTTDDITVLCTGDIHLGRHPSRIPEGLDDRTFSPRSVWQDVVEAAVGRDVDAVVVSGDVVDRENRYFEAYGAFEEGARRLAAAEIPTVTVAGNHDFDQLPRMVRDLDLETLHLLGENGTWERRTLERDGDPLVHVDGWSFPDEHVHESPLEGYDLPDPGDDGVPRIGLLHADLDARGSEYAPVESSELRTTSAAAWVLGHIHSPGVRVDSDPLTLYPGSPQALDPGEPGAHGPWLLTLDAEGGATAAQLPLASVRYDEIAVDVSGAADPKDVRPTLSEQIEAHVQDVQSTSSTGRVELLLASVELTGRTDAHADLVERQASIREQVRPKVGSVEVRIDAIDVETRPAVDLESLADDDDAAAHVADLLLALENGTPEDEHESLIADSLDAMDRTYDGDAYAELRREADVERPGRADAIQRLEREARLLLDTLLAGREGEG